MQSFIFKTLVKFVMGFVADMLTKQNVQFYGDKVFDLIEDFVKDSNTTVDDTIVLPIVAKFRVLLDIPDLPDVEEIGPAVREIEPEDMPDPAGN